LNADLNGVFDFTQHIKPDWNHAATYKRFGADVVELPVDPSVKFSSDFRNMTNNKIRYNKEHSRTSFLLLNSGKNYSAFIMTVIADSSYVGNDLSKLAHNTYRKHDADFSGMVLYFTPKGQFVRSYGYKNGQIMPATLPDPLLQQNANSVFKTNTLASRKTVTTTKTLVTEAPISYTCVVWTTDNYIDDVLVSSSQTYTNCTPNYAGGGDGGDSGGGVGTSPPTCPSGTGMSARFTSRALVGRAPIGSPPPPPSDPGFPDPTTTTTSNCSVVVVDSAATDTNSDPCVKKAKINAMAANKTIDSLNAILLADSNSTVEHGTNENLKAWPGNTFLGTNIGTGSASSFTPVFNWDSTFGFTIGWTHLHPGGTSESPDDIFVMIDNLSNTALQAAGSTAIQYYKNNVTMTVVTKNGNFVVTVNDWGQLQTLFTTFKNSPLNTTSGLNAFDDDYVAKAQAYATANPGAPESEAGAYALMTIFGSSINIFSAPKGSSVYTPLTLKTDAATNKKTVANLPCPL
jgi:hypothetical protein